VRAITYTFRRGGGPFRDVSVGGVHLHHYLWGASACSPGWVRGERQGRVLVDIGVGLVAAGGTTFSAIPLLRRLRRNRRRLP
jgi:hypothetical protein